MNESTLGCSATLCTDGNSKARARVDLGQAPARAYPGPGPGLFVGKNLKGYQGKIFLEFLDEQKLRFDSNLKPFEQYVHHQNARRRRNQRNLRQNYCENSGNLLGRR